MRHFGLSPNGGNSSHMYKKIKRYGIDTSHFLGPGHNAGKVLNTRKKPEEVLIHNKEIYGRTKGSVLTRSLKEIGREYFCAMCGCKDIWNGLPLKLHVDHINGDWQNNLPENLRFLCPNCHSQTLTFGSRKKKIICDGQNSSEMKPSILAAHEA